MTSSYGGNKRRKRRLFLLLHPRLDRLPIDLFEGHAEGTVAFVSAFVRQFCGRDILPGLDGCLVETHEVRYAQGINIGIIGDALIGKIAAEVGVVGTNVPGQMSQRQRRAADNTVCRCSSAVTSTRFWQTGW